VHNHGDLKRLTIENLEYYVVKDDRLATLFDRMHENNAKVFLLTNSGYEYTDHIMGYLLNDVKKERCWRSYFDYVLVDAKKPLFFAEGTSLKEIDAVSVILKLLIYLTN
jgi:5'-nucleotidase